MNAQNQPAAAKKLNLKQRYGLMTRGLGWDTTYESMDEVFPYDKFEGIKIHDWDKWEDPFRLTMDAYWKYQAEKERKLYAIIDAFSQNNGHLNVTDARYINAIKIFLTGVTPIEYNAHRGFAMVGRQLRGVGPRVACQMQAIDELRHCQTQVHTLSHYNKYFNGFHSWPQNFDRAWYLSVPKSFVNDAMTAGPFEFLTATSFSFEFVLTNLLFMPFMSGAAYNGDMATVTFGFSAQSDEARHMTLGLEVIKFMLEQDPDNVPIVQRWIDKWFWRGYRLLSLVAMMMDYMLPKRIMSWREAWEIYFEQSGGALFDDLSRYGIQMPKYWEQSVKEKHHISHQTWSLFYQYCWGAGVHAWMPQEDEMAWLSEQYPQSFDAQYRPRFEQWKAGEQAGKRWFNTSLPCLCQTCQLPMVFTEPDDPTRLAHRESRYLGDAYHFCSDGCKDIFDHEPEKYVQALLPVHQILQGNAGGPELEDVIRSAYIDPVADAGAFETSQDAQNWARWKQPDSPIVRAA
ncbi:phenol 2-monooxygenase [Burkholderia multivorans]|uniref:aromatic/alkene/methane monooxygenase hydroxylase/oxygenase subunit alpha n=1 Tax=Burkholderia cepacia complex TaxID=87882 RepID=UPI00075ABFCB|nr:MULTISPECIES: aromatic/alkene/methane monooxygenase hydroxylase/oxygenase subunit alpha [Burkholderia cepacia complex]KVV21668.1 phenol 2-monooxygenase [Burkholderia multivorans]MCA7888645.1 aromatic/alkene/methane monooxygenase hydroxylase/oxygenase subunit alpha [Burkholderia contaminans]MDN7576810.1 aromatic/alkene/methane monooxygenase hydroxylase/oxygenase subunit alpha [Burkholderia contaminans]PRF33399.1 YHS domain-containing protein [Burkholderia multivorans]